MEVALQSPGGTEVSKLQDSIDLSCLYVLENSALGLDLRRLGEDTPVRGVSGPSSRASSLETWAPKMLSTNVPESTLMHN